MKTNISASKHGYAGVMEHYVRKDPIPYASTAAPVSSHNRLARAAQKLWMALRGLMRDRKASRYTSLAPRHPDGSRTAVMSFNSSGGGAGSGGA